MTQENQQIVSQGTTNRRRWIFLLVFIGLILIATSAFNLIVSQQIEEMILDSSALTADPRWVIHLACAVISLMICLGGIWITKDRGFRSVLLLWLFGALLTVFSTPIKLVFMTSQSLTQLIRVAALFVVLLVARGIERVKPSHPLPAKSAWLFRGEIVFLCCLVAIPWVSWGALGSWLDSVLALICGILFAIYCTRSIHGLFMNSQANSEDKPSHLQLTVNGLVIVIFLLECVSGLAGNGAQTVLLLSVPVCGMLVSRVFDSYRKAADQGQGGVAWLLGTTFSLPLLFFDMDEIILLFNRTTGETYDWALKCAWLTLVFILLMIVVTILLRRKKKVRQLPRQWRVMLVLLGWTGLLAAYFGWGQVGLFGDHQFIILKQQADLSEVKEITNVTERRMQVFVKTVTAAESTQKDLRSKLDRWDVDYTPYYLVNALDVNASEWIRLFLLQDHDVDRILESPRLRPLPETSIQHSVNYGNSINAIPWNLEKIQAARVWNELGIDGSGVVIGLADSGIDGMHPDLGGAYRGAQNGSDGNWYDPWYGSTTPVDWMSHGTKVMGVILGQKTGVAPGAQWIGCVNLARNLGNPADYLSCMQFLFAPFPQNGDALTDGDPTRGANIINNSWGCPQVEGCDPEIFQSAVEALETAGVFMSVSAGNSGDLGCSSVNDPPALYSQVFSVGSINSSGERSDFSSIGPVIIDGSGTRKPDLMAPGEKILTTSPGRGYAYVSGTSFSAPHVAGVVALMWSANPALIGEIETTSLILKQTADPLLDDRLHCGTNQDLVGSGILDAYAAVKAALEHK